MTALTADYRTGSDKPRRRRRPKAHPCRLESCGEETSSRSGWCSFVCKIVDTELRQAQNVCRHVGSSGLTASLWASAVTLSDAWTAYQSAERQVFSHAVEAGYTPEQWRMVKNDTA